MYKNLTKEELKIIRDTTATESEPAKRTTLLKNALLYILIFTFFVAMGVLMVFAGKWME